MLFQNAWRELPTTLRLSAPIMAGFLGQMLMGLTDSIMVGKVGVIPLAACAFGNTISMVFFVFGFGLMSSVSVCASQVFGAGKTKQVGEVLAAGSIIGGLVGLILGGIMLIALPWYSFLGQPEAIVTEARNYLILIALSVAPVLVFTAAKSFSEALSRPWMPFWIVIFDVALNVFLNWVFIFGNLGAPALGLTGAGIATLLARLVGLVAIFSVIWFSKSYRVFLPEVWKWGRISIHFPALIRLGLPSAFQVLGEVSAFSLASLMMGWISIEALAAHQIALSCAATTFMIPLGLSTALTVRVGQVMGARFTERIRPISMGGLALAAAVMVVTAAVFILGGAQIAALFVQDAAVIQLAASLLVIAGIFQVFDGVQITSVGCLRGMGDVRVPMLWTYFNYWVVGLPCSAILAFGFGWGAQGVWIGLALGLASASLILGTRLWRRSE
jgi:multidrug resistance protein, MATE family